MFEEFDVRMRAKIVRDGDGIARILSHTDRFIATEASTPRAAARDYLGRYGHVFGVRPQHLRNLLKSPERSPTAAGLEYRYLAQKPQFDLTTVAFNQTYFGLPVWEAGLSVTMKHGPLRIIGARSTLHREPAPQPPVKTRLAQTEKLDAKILAAHLGLPARAAGPLKIDSHRLMIYRHDAARLPHPPTRRRSAFHAEAPTLPLPLPPVHASIRDGAHYVVRAVYFSFAPPAGELHSVILIEVETGSVLHLRPLVENVTGLVFPVDPATLGGPPADSSNAALNAWRRPVELPALAAPTKGGQELRGKRVRVADVLEPVIAPPIRPAGANFAFAARTNNFAAVNAYYHCHRAFQLVEDLGFSVADYFCNTKFPTRVDHRGHFSDAKPLGIEINAHCAATVKNGKVGIGYTTFSLADLRDLKQPIGIAGDYRIVLHELLGHGVLYNHIGGALLKFAHSAGDSFAAIVHDPDSKARDRRYETFPWLTGVPKDQQRRHDRTAAAGWGWNGNIARHPFDQTLDWKGYSNEQILSSTMFRFYRAIGGDADDLAARQFAADITCRLLLAAIQSFTAATSPDNAAHFAAALMKADQAAWPAKGLCGGAYHKVIRWAFEKQGLYQRTRGKAPNKRPGMPPPVDVYIEDGRHGEYDYRAGYADCRAIWNRRRPDRGTAHQTPHAGVVNYAFVKIKNRGFLPATGVTVRAFHCGPSAQLVYPRDWRPMRTASRRVERVPPNAAREIVLGPFAWVPAGARESMLMVASAPGDASNIDSFTARESIANARLVPHDNNIAQRDVKTAKPRRRASAARTSA